MVGFLFLTSGSLQKAYASPWPPSPNETGDTWSFKWVNAGEIEMDVTPKGATMIPIQFDNGGTGLDFTITTCNQGCMTIISQLADQGFIKSASDANVSIMATTDQGSDVTLELLDSSPTCGGKAGCFGGAATPYSVTGVGNTQTSAGITWYNSNGSLTVNNSADAAKEAGYLEFISPTQIYDKNTGVYYDTEASGQFANSSTEQQYINDGYTYYWPTSATMNPQIPMSNGDCRGGIVVGDPSSNSSTYEEVWLEPATPSGSGSNILCWFGSSSDGLHLVDGSGSAFIASPDPAPGSTNAWPLGENLNNMNMEYAMFQWVDTSGEIAIGNMSDSSKTPTLVNLNTSQTYQSQYSKITGYFASLNNSNTQIFTTDTCLTDGLIYFPFLAVTNYSTNSGLSDLNIGTNTKAYFYAPDNGSNGGGADSGWTEGWSYTTNSGAEKYDLSCLFDNDDIMPANNVINTSNGNDYTYVAYPNYSVCNPAPCSATAPPSGGSTSSYVDTCFDSETGHTYLCGNGSTPSTNENSVDPVVHLNCTPTQADSCPDNYYVPDSSSILGYSFVEPNECYDAELLPNGDKQYPKLDSVYAWVEQSSKVCAGTDYLLSTAENNTPLLALPPLGSGGTDIAGTDSVGHNCTKTGSNCLVNTFVDGFIRFLSVAVSLVAIIALVTGGIQYSTSRDNPEAVKAARKRIFNAVLGVVVYFLLYAFLNFIVPGGV
jgi:hypothetical protein